MTRTKLMRKVAKRTGVDLVLCEMVYDTIFDEITDALMRGDSFRIDNFLRIEPFEYPGRKKRSLETGEYEYFPPVKTVRCKISKNLKDLVKGK